MKRYKAIVAYDGTDYTGWIQQQNRPSIVQTLRDSFCKTFGSPVYILGASKTDAGVHALGQVAQCRTEVNIETARMCLAWNNALPPSIVIRSLVVDEQFHPHHQVKQKIYYYHFFVRRPLPLVARYGYYVTYPLDLNRLKGALTLFEGTHNFSAFYTGNDRGDAVRTIDMIRLEYLPSYQAYRMVVAGERFLRHMVRRIVGAALAVASRGRITDADIRYALQTGVMHSKLPTAPAQGLLLRKVIYGSEKSYEYSV